jgi:PAS domain S-box-containing protein
MFWNRNGNIMDANDGFLDLIGYSREDLRAGRINWREITPPEYAEVDQRSLEEVAAKGFCTTYEKEYIRKDGSRVPVLIGSASFEDNPNEGVRFVLDLTERKKLEQQFLRAQRMECIGTLAGGIAHDLNNILAPIMMSIDILKMTVTNEQAKSILETIEVSSKRGADIVRQVLSFARGMEGERIEVQPKHLLKDIEAIIRDTFPKNIQQELSLPDDPWTISGDPTLLHQILLNLCVNARDAMPNGGKLTLKVENCVLDEQYATMNTQAKPGRYVLITVTDTGTGIPPGIIDKIFEPFFTTKEVGKGTGLGLSTVIGIVKSHEGVINVYSEPGKGTTFRVYLPAMEHTSEARKKETQSVSLPRGKGEMVLIVDDEASVLTITSQTLQAFGYRVVTATDGAEAVAVYARHQNDIAVVLTDMMMPVMDGQATIRALQRINPAVKIVAASGLNANGAIAKAPDAGVKRFLLKPYTAGTLLKALRTILDEGS